MDCEQFLRLCPLLFVSLIVVYARIGKGYRFISCRIRPNAICKQFLIVRVRNRSSNLRLAQHDAFSLAD